MLPEDLNVELAEDREWARLRDTVEQAHEDLDEPRPRADEDDDQPRFRFVDEDE